MRSSTHERTRARAGRDLRWEFERTRSARSAFPTVKRQAVAISGLGLLLLLIGLSLFEHPGPVATATSFANRLRTAGAPVGWMRIPAFLAVGTAAGFLGGMLGMGGGVMKMAGMLLLFKLDMFFARAVSLATMFVASASASWTHVRAGRAVMPLVWPMLLPALIGVSGGAYIGHQLPPRTLTHVFGVFVILLGIHSGAQLCSDPREHVLSSQFARSRLDGTVNRMSRFIGGMHGFVSGLLGISGGVLALPMQQMLINVPARNAIANGLIISAASTGLGSLIVVLLSVRRGDFMLNHFAVAVVSVGVGAAIGAQLGARLGERVNPSVLRLLFVLISVVSGLSIFF